MGAEARMAPLPPGPRGVLEPLGQRARRIPRTGGGKTRMAGREASNRDETSQREIVPAPLPRAGVFCVHILPARFFENTPMKGFSKTPHKEGAWHTGLAP